MKLCAYHVRTLGFIVSVGLIQSQLVTAWEISTHRAISQEATAKSSVNSILRDSLGLERGTRSVVDGAEPRDWVSIGSEREDDMPRFLNHFHHSLRPWSEAGLSDILSGTSSVIWAQTQNQSFATGSWSWQETRNRFHLALTSEKKEDRDSFLAQTFRGLGHQIHLIQDAASVPHARNESHVTGFSLEAWMLNFQTTRSSDFAGLLGRTPRITLDPDLFREASDSLGPIPIGKYIDGDRYTGSNPDATTMLRDGTDATGQPVKFSPFGLTEYTNANFVHRDTILTDTLPQDHKWWSPYPRRSSTNLAGLVHPETITAEDGQADLTLYVKKERDGELIDHFLKPTYAATVASEAVGPELLALQLQLDDRVYEDYASKLLPRAVGYSAGLLDYFFRGKLDVDLVPDPQSTDPRVVKLSGTNGSSDKLDGGTLTLYADDPATGLRNPVPALDPNFSVAADPGQPVESAKFQINAEAERFMAVYKGKLGGEAPQGDFPGGVIGKVLGGVRAESIIFDFTDNKRKLRTPSGIYPLSPPAESLANIQWGDQDDTFVGTRDRYTTDQFLAFKINRLPNSPEPLLVDGPGGTGVVSGDLLKAANFPFDSRLSLGTVNYTQSCHIRQLLVTYHIVDTFIFDKDKNVYNFGFRQVNVETETVVNQTLQTSQTFSVVLDRESQAFGIPYTWWVTEVGLDAQQRLLAIVKAELTFPQSSFPMVSLRARNRNGQFEDRSQVSCNERFPIHDFSWAVIDVEKGELLGATSSSLFLPSSTDSNTYSIIQLHFASQFTGGGDKDGAGDQAWVDVPWFVEPNPAYSTVEMTTVPREFTSGQSLALPGLYREDLQTLVAPLPQMSSDTFGFSEVHFVDDVAKLNRATRFVISSSSVAGGLTFPLQAQRIRPSKGTGPELLLLVGKGQDEHEITDGTLVRWSPQSPSNTVLAVPEGLPAANYYDLQFATSEAALLSVESLTEDSADFYTLFIDLARRKAQRFNLDGDYVLLDPKFLYNLTDTKFHTLDPSLRATALPRRLADAPRHFEAAYHLIRLP